MCIEPPRPRFVPASLRHQLGEHPERVETLREAVAVAAMGRRDHVGRAERPARADGRRLLPDRQVHEARHLAVAVQRGHALLEPADHEHPPMHLEQVGVAEHEPCIVLVGTNRRSAMDDRAMAEQIDIPASFAGAADVTGKRVVITGAGRGLGRLLAHAFSQGGARVALVARTETDLKAVADELPGPSLVLSGDVTDEEFNEAVADATVAEWGGVDVWICNAGISPDPGRTAQDRSVGVARDPRGEPHGRVPRRPRRGPRDGRGRATDLHRLGARGTAARRAHRVQRVEGRPRRPGEGSRARSRGRRASP